MSNETLSAEELGNKLLQSVKEMKVGNVARVSLVEPNEVAEARGKTGLTQREFAEVLHIVEALRAAGVLTISLVA